MNIGQVYPFFPFKAGPFLHRFTESQTSQYHHIRVPSIIYLLSYISTAGKCCITLLLTLQPEVCHQCSSSQFQQQGTPFLCCFAFPHPDSFFNCQNHFTQHCRFSLQGAEPKLTKLQVKHRLFYWYKSGAEPYRGPWRTRDIPQVLCKWLICLSHSSLVCIHSRIWAGDQLSSGSASA